MQVCQIYGYVISLIKRMYGSGLMAITGNELLTLTIQPPKQNVFCRYRRAGRCSHYMQGEELKEKVITDTASTDLEIAAQ